MRVCSALIVAAIATYINGRTFNVHEAVSSVSALRSHARDSFGRPVLPVHEDDFKHARPRTIAKHDVTVRGFLGEDYASNADWTKFTNKGGALMCGLNGGDVNAGQQRGDKRTPPSAATPWNGDLKQELATWKSSEVNPSTYSCKMDNHWKISEAMEALGLNGRSQSEGGDNVCYRVEHWDPKLARDGQQVPAINQWYTVDGTEYQPADPSKLPHLHAFSDILWGCWARANPDIRIIKYFSMLGISNDQTNQLIATCLRNAGKELSEWPGAQFDTKTDEGHALLGSPNGAAFAYFLTQHKRELGEKTISKVTVFRAKTDDDVVFVDPCLVFYVTDNEIGGFDD